MTLAEAKTLLRKLLRQIEEQDEEILRLQGLLVQYGPADVVQEIAHRLVIQAQAEMAVDAEERSKAAGGAR